MSAHPHTQQKTPHAVSSRWDCARSHIYVIVNLQFYSSMSNIVFVNAGQCGNQLGYDVLESLFQNCYDDSEVNTFFRLNQKDKCIARAICLDTEPKAVNACLDKAVRNKIWSYEKLGIAYRHGGAGNNWSVGYNMCSGEFLEIALDAIRRELEHCDALPIIITVHSIGGGTGSGLGTKISEECSDSFSDVTRLNITIAPYHFSEVVVQHYNSSLSLSKISNAADGVLLFENEVAEDLGRTMRKIARPSLDDINSTIATNIIPMCLPKSFGSNSISLRSSTLSDDVELLCSHPSYKFLDIKCSPQTSDKAVEYTYDPWKALLRRIEMMQVSRYYNNRYILIRKQDKCRFQN